MMLRSKLSVSAFALLSTFAALTGCMNAEPGEGQDTENPPTASGFLSVSVAGNDVYYALKQADGTFAQLDLSHMKQTTWGDSDEAIEWRTAGGSPVDVFGTRQANGSITVDTIEPSSAINSSDDALVTTGARRILVFNVNFDGKGALGTNKDAENMMAAAAAHFEASSYGKLQLEYDVVGPINVKFGTCDDLYNWMDDAKAAAQKLGKDLSRYQHFSLFGKINCGYSGLGQEPGSLTWNAGFDPVLIIHEVGHNFGLWHASGNKCTNASGAPVTMSDKCTKDEYGDPFDPMGWGYQHQYNANYKLDLGWLPSANVKTITSDQTVTLAPLSAPSGATQMLRLKGPGDVLYSVEFRTPTATDKFDAGSTATNGVLIHALHTQASDAERAYLLDMNPDAKFNFRDAALTVGNSYTFFGTKAKITVLSVSPSGAKVELTGLGNGPPPDTGDRVQAVNSLKCLSVMGGSTASGALAIQRACSGADDQEWQFTSAGTSTFTIKNVNSGKCLEVQGASKVDGAKVQQSDCKSVADQQWKQVNNTDGTVSLVSVNSGKCLDVYRASTADGAQYIQWTCHSGTNQRFRRQ